jgi:hypothetical protein
VPSLVTHLLLDICIVNILPAYGLIFFTFLKVSFDEQFNFNKPQLNNLLLWVILLCHIEEIFGLVE